MQRVLVPAAIAPTHPPINCAVRDFAGQCMGTTWSVRLVDTAAGTAGDLRASIQAELDRVVAQMSHWLADSDLGRYNRAPPCTWHPLPDAFHAVMQCALDVAERSGGAYDPAAGALVNLWGFGPHGRYAEADFAPPDATAVSAAMADCGWQRVRLDQERRLFQPGAVQLDLSSIAKGYAVDLVAQRLHAHGIDHFLVEVGGELRGAGMKSDGQPWWVGLEAPASQAVAPTLAALHGLSIATSGDYRRSFCHDGQRYAHTLDPRTGYPVDSGVASVTVLHPECMLADAWSTALTVMGVDAGLACADAQGLAARFIVRNGDHARSDGAHGEHYQAHYSEHLSAAMREMLQ